MNWSTVKKTRYKKPIGWWYHKLLCEKCYFFNDNKGYYRHLDIMFKHYRLDIYGTIVQQKSDINIIR